MDIRIVELDIREGEIIAGTRQNGKTCTVNRQGEPVASIDDDREPSLRIRAVQGSESLGLVDFIGALVDTYDPFRNGCYC